MVAIFHFLKIFTLKYAVAVTTERGEIYFSVQVPFNLAIVEWLHRKCNYNPNVTVPVHMPAVFENWFIYHYITCIFFLILHFQNRKTIPR